MNYRISIIDFTNLNNFLKFLKKVKNSDGTKAPPPRATPISPGSYYEPGLKPLRPCCLRTCHVLPPLVPVRVPTGTSISPDLLVPVGGPGLMAQPNRD